MIRILVSCLAIVLTTAAISPAQEFWFGGSGNDRAHAITRTSDGCYIVAGSSFSPEIGGTGAYALKLDQAGLVLWEHGYTGITQESIDDVIPTLNGGCIAVGSQREVVGYRRNALIAELDGNGLPEWVKVHGREEEGEEIKAVAHAEGAEYIVVGYMSLPGVRGVWGPAAAKLDEFGRREWVWVIDDRSYDELEAVIPATDGGYIAAGRLLFEEMEYRALAMKFTEDGTVEWMKTYDMGYWGGFTDVCHSSDGGYVLSGGLLVDEYDLYGDAFLLRIDTEGNEIWRSIFGGDREDSAAGVLRAREGGYLSAGYKSIPTGVTNTGYQRQAWAVRVDENGTIEEEWLFGGSGDDDAYDIVHAWGGGYVLAGRTTSYGAGGDDVYVVMFGNHSSR